MPRMQADGHLNVVKEEKPKNKNSPLRAEALTKADSQVRYNDSQTTKTASNFSTQKEAA